MSSILTNQASLAAIANLTSAQNTLVKYQSEASTGLKIQTAADNAAYWAIGNGMTSNLRSLQTVSDGLAQSKAIMNVTYTALNSVINETKAIQADIVAAMQPGNDLNSIQSDIAAHQSLIISIANAASFDGQNWLVDNWKIDNTESVSYSFSDTKSNVFAKENWNGSYTQTVDEVDTTQAKDDWGNIISGQTETNSGETDKFTTIGAAHVKKTTLLPTSVTSSGSNPIVQETFSDMPISYGKDTGTLFSSLSRSKLKLFDNYTGTNNSSTAANYADETDSSQTISNKASSSYNNSVGLIYDQSLPNGGLGLLTDSFNTSVSTSPSQVLPLSENLLTLNVQGLGQGDLQAALSMVSDVTKQIIGAASQLGASINLLQTQQTSLSTSMDTLSMGISSLVDADINQVAARLSALQVQVQLGLQSLSIANSNSAVILKLFQ
jgi:flagellin